MRDIAERSSMTSGRTIYGHFTDKANLLGEAVRYRIAEDLERRGGRRYGAGRTRGLARPPVA